MEDTKIVKSIEESGLLIKDVKQLKMRQYFIRWIRSQFIRNLLACKGARATEGAISEGAINAGDGGIKEQIKKQLGWNRIFNV